MNDSEMIFSIAIWLVIIASLIYLLIRKIIKEENEDFENRDKIIETSTSFGLIHWNIIKIHCDIFYNFRVIIGY